MPGSRVTDASPLRNSSSVAYSPGLERHEDKNSRAENDLGFAAPAALREAKGMHWAISDSDASQPLLSGSAAPDALATSSNLGDKVKYAIQSIRMPTRMPLTRSRKAQVAPPAEQRDARPMTELIRQHDQTYAAILSTTRELGATKPRNSTRDAINEANRTRDLLKTRLETLKVVRSMQDATMSREGKSWKASLASDGLQGVARAELTKRIAEVEAFRAVTQSAIDATDDEIARTRIPRNWTLEAGEEARNAGWRLEQSKAHLVRTLEAIDAERASLALRWTWVVPNQSVPAQLQNALPVVHEIDG